MPTSNQASQPLTRIKRDLLFSLAVALFLSTNILSIDWTWQIDGTHHPLTIEDLRPNHYIKRKTVAEVRTFWVHDLMPPGVGENKPSISIRMLGGWGRGRFICPAAVDYEPGKFYEVDNGDAWTRIVLHPQHSDVISRSLHLTMAYSLEPTIIYNFLPLEFAPPEMNLYYLGNMIGKARQTVVPYRVDTLLEVEVLDSGTHGSAVFETPHGQSVTISAGTRAFLNIDPRLLDKSDPIPIRILSVSSK